MATCRNKVFGFETKFLPEQQLRREWIGLPLKTYLELLQELGFTHFILLRRRNYLRRAVSALAGRQTKRWQTRRRAGMPTRVRIDPRVFPTGNIAKPLLEHFRDLDMNYHSASEALEGIPCLELEYEMHILTDPSIAYRMVLDFLGLEALTDAVSIRLQRTNPFPLEDMIENYDEVVSALTDTSYEWMLRT